MKKILISGYYGFSNSGDDAILSSICRDIEELSRSKKEPISITILSNNPESTKKEYGVRSINRFSYMAVRSEILKSDIVLMGGGSLLQDTTSTRSLLYYLWIIWFAKKHNKKCMLYGNGIGPIYKKFNRRLTRWVANKIDVITLREKLSSNELKSLKIVKPETYVTADPVFNLPTIKVDVNKILQTENVDISKPFAAVLFRSWEDTNYIKKTAKLCDYIIENYDMNILLIPMKYPTDLSISTEIREQMNNKAYLLQNKYDAFTMIEIIGQMKLVLSMRLHALLYSAIKGVPMIGFVYDPKVDYYLKELNMFSAGRVEQYNLEEVEKQVTEIITNYNDVQQQLKQRVDILKHKAILNRELLLKLMD